MNSRILILGKGFIGSRIAELLNFPVTNRKVHTLTDAISLLEEHGCGTLINCVGYTGERNVDDCEKDPEKTIFLNTFLPVLLAEACLRKKVRMVHLSSGCIYHFDYKKSQPIKEDKEPDFFDLFYSRTKIYAESVLKNFFKKIPLLILRLRIPLDDIPHPKNILTKLINSKKVIDIPNSITYLPDFARALKHLLDIGAEGIYNVVNSGSLRYPELLEVYKRYNRDFKYSIVDFKELKLIRTNLILSNDKLRASGFLIPEIHRVLEKCVKNYIRYL